MRHRLLPVYATALAGLCCTARTPADFQDAIARLEPAIVLVQAPVDDPEDGKTISTGTGFIIDSEGHIVTNEHIIANITGAPTVIVRNRESLRAATVLRDPDHDIAVLRVEAEGLVPAPLGDSDEVAKGAAIGVGGYPLAEDLQNGGFELTASFHEGRINAIRVGRTDLTGERMTFFEFDARVNAGNSGGPLFLRDTGEVVGVVVAKLGADTGIGFAIPINVVLDVWRNPPFEAQRREVHSAAAFIGRGGLYRDTSAGFELRVPEGFKSIAPRDGLTAQFDAVQGECLLFVKSCFAAQPLSQCARLLESTLGVRATQTRVADLDGRPGLEVRYQRGDVAGKARMCVEKGRFYALGYVSPAAEARAWEEAFEEALDQFLVLGPEPQAGGAHQYVNEEFRFRVRAPEGWRMERPDEPALRVGVVSPDGRCTVAFGAERLQEEMTPEGYAEAVEGDFCGTLTENGLMQLGRHRAVQRVYRHTDADGQWRLRVVAATRKRTGYLAVACAREPDFRKHQEEIDGIIRSFELFPATESATPGGAPRFEVVRVVASATSTIQDGQRSTFAPDVEAVYCVFDYAGAKPNTHVAVRWYFKGKCQRRLSRNLVLQSGEGRAAFALRRGEDELFPRGAWRADIVHRGEVLGSATFRIR